MRHKYNTTAAYKNFFFLGGGDLVNQKRLSHIIGTLTKKNLLQLVGLHY